MLEKMNITLKKRPLPIINYVRHVSMPIVGEQGASNSANSTNSHGYYSLRNSTISRTPYPVAFFGL